jgi:tol-pal system protein YbgF
VPSPSLSRHAAVALLLAGSALTPAAFAQNQPGAQQPAAPAGGARHNDGRAPGVIELMNQIEEMQGEMNRLRGQLEVLNNGLENAQKRQRDMYLDLDTRVRRIEQAGGASAPRAESTAPAEAEARPKPATPADLEARIKKLEQTPGTTAPAAAAPAPANTAAAAPPAGNTAQSVPAPTAPAAPTAPTKPTAPAGAPATATPASDQHVRKAYDNGLAAYRAGDYQGAIAAFDGIVKRYPRDPLAANAQYWIGDAWFNLRDFKSAAAAQQALITNYGDSAKVPDAMLNLGSAYSALGDGPGARKAWEDLVARYPQSEAADKARQRLARLK